jgi:hypothetical protein
MVMRKGQQSSTGSWAVSVPCGGDWSDSRWGVGMTRSIVRHWVAGVTRGV